MTNNGGVAGHILRSFIERVERLEEEKKNIMEDIKDVYAEAKSSGFEPKIMRQVVRLRKMDGDKRAELEALLDIYLHALEGYQGGSDGASGEASDDDASEDAA